MENILRFVVYGFIGNNKKQIFIKKQISGTKDLKQKDWVYYTIKGIKQILFFMFHVKHYVER